MDIVGAASFGLGKGLVRAGQAIRASKIGKAPKGIRGMTDKNRNKRSAAAAWHRKYERNVIQRHSRIDRAYGLFATGHAAYGEYKDYRRRSR